jgi:hypothetical protein
VQADGRHDRNSALRRRRTPGKHRSVRSICELD